MRIEDEEPEENDAVAGDTPGNPEPAAPEAAPVVDERAPLEIAQDEAAHNLAALWVARRGVDVTWPACTAEAAIWRFDDVRPAIMEGGEIITPEDAFRRVLVLENPA